MGSTLKILTAKLLTSSTGGVPQDITPTSSAAKGWLIKNIYFYNYGTSGQSVTVDLKIKQGGTARMLLKAAISVAPGGTGTSGNPSVLAKEFALDLNVPDVLHAVLTSSAGTPNVDCVINGVEKDQ
jgi:hypothetical protein